MKRIFFTVTFFVFLVNSLLAQSLEKYTPLYYHRASLFEKLPIKKSDIIFLGNSLTHYGEWAEIFNNRHVRNRGISGDIAEGVYDRLDPIIKGKPKKIFLMIGVNNLSRNYSVDSVLKCISKIADKITKETPRTKLYIQSGLPVNDSYTNYPKHANKGPQIIELNSGLKKMCKEKGLVFIDIYPLFKCKDSENLNPDLTNDGLHLNGDGYMIWKEAINPYL